MEDICRINSPKGTLGVDEEQTTESDTLVLEEDAVVARDAHAAVSNQRELEVGAKSTLLPWLRSPCEVGELGVGGDACTLGAQQ